MLATVGGHTLTVKALIGGGADPNIQDSVSGSDCSTAWLCINVCYCNPRLCVFSIHFAHFYCNFQALYIMIFHIYPLHIYMYITIHCLKSV